MQSSGAITKHVLVVVDTREGTAGRKKDGVDLFALWQAKLKAESVPYALAVSPLDIGDVAICVSDTPFVIPDRNRFIKSPSVGLPDPIVVVDSEPSAPFPPAPLIIVERKALPDLISSYGDGRYADQKARLINSDAKQVVLLVEGYSSATVQDAKMKKTLLSTFVHTMFRDGISVYHTRTIQETFEWLDWTCAEMARGKLERSHGYMDRVKYTDNIQMARKANLTPEHGLELQLASIPGVSAKMARAVSDLYPNMMSLCEAYQLADVKARPKLLADLTYRGDSGKQRRLATSSQKIYAYVHGVPVEPTKKKAKKDATVYLEDDE